MSPQRVIFWILLTVIHAAGAEGSKDKAGDGEPSWVQREGVALRLVADHKQVSAGTRFTAGLVLRHAPGYHTYWHSPGVVGLPTSIEWDLPAGVSVGPTLWPGPELTKMAEVTAWGYEREVALLSEITIGAGFRGETLPMRAKVCWMACSERCHPGWLELETTLPVGDVKLLGGDRALIDTARREIPVDLPADWHFGASRVRESGGFRVKALLQGLDQVETKGLVFFCNDNQVHSDLAQQFRWGPQGLVMRFPASEFAPQETDCFGGVLYHPGGWPGLASRWLRVKTNFR